VNELVYICDDARHLICTPYTVENLHRMARDLGIARCWFHAHERHPHYDIPKRRIAEIKSKCLVVTSRALLNVINGAKA
jgi:hypothetical protein